MAKIREVIVNYPAPENMDEYNRRLAKAMVKIIANKLPLEGIDQLIERLKKVED